MTHSPAAAFADAPSSAYLARVTSIADSGRSARLAAVGAALLFSTGGAAIKLTQMSAWQVASFRAAVAALALFLLLPGARRGWSWRTLAVGAVHGATMVLFVASNKLTTAASSIFLQSTAPLYVLLLAPLALHERLRPRDLVFAAVLGLGLILLVAGTPPPAATAPDPRSGNLLAAASGLTWALTVVGLRWLGRQPGARTEESAVCAGNLLACLVCLPAAVATTVAPPRAIDLGLVTFIGVAQIAIPYALLTRAVRHLGAVEIVLLLLLEPVLNPVWAWALLGEAPGALALSGGLVVLGATAAKAWLEEGKSSVGDTAARP